MVKNYKAGAGVVDRDSSGGHIMAIFAEMEQHLTVHWTHRAEELDAQNGLNREIAREKSQDELARAAMLSVIGISLLLRDRFSTENQ